ncbi:MAG: excinuclease ABC subunit UvrA [Clostridia bacterium]|nr:excinuclease ABC subunit UvrA [Clostridia bacterium]MDD4387331.1 excinuclease ABC subunit UvrA [Clostridia bacterium]
MNIKILGARENNLKNINLELEKHKVIVVSGVSGSGKSSLVFDVIYAMGQTSFYDTLSTYVVKNLPKINKPDVDEISNLSPCVMIDQKSLGQNPRSTVGTVTEIYSYLRLLYSRVGYPIMDSEYFSFNTSKGVCQKCGGLGTELIPDLNKLIDFDKSLNEGAVRHRTWAVQSRYWNIQKAINYFDINKKLKDYNDDEINMLLYSKPFQYQNKSTGFVQSFSYEGIINRIVKRQKDARGLDINDYDEKFFTTQKCSECEGSRLNKMARDVLVNKKSLIELLNMEINELYSFVNSIEGEIALPIIDRMKIDMKNIIEMGIGYLTLNRGINTLSNGESQKIKIVKHLRGNLNELIYIMDEPSIGLHHRDIKKIIEAIKELVSKENTVLIVEHNRTIIESADCIVDIGPLSGESGGEIIFVGNVEDIIHNDKSITGKCLRQRHKININNKYIKDWYEVNNINVNNIQNLNVKIPKNILTCITGVSGSGKSSLIKYIADIDDKVIKIGGEPIGISSRSNPATYSGVFDLIRKEFANTNNIDVGVFSFNSKGACDNCRGLGYKVMDMHFLGDIKQTCDVCHGKRYKDEVLMYLYKDKNISDVLDMTVSSAVIFFDNKGIVDKLSIINDVGLGYLKLGQSFNTLSGGEIQRVNMASYLSKKGNIYIMDEPTNGLHLNDINVLLGVINKLIDRGNTVIAIEHNLDFIINADYIIDMGPEGGKNGGKIMFEGNLKNILNEQSFTASAIREYVNVK